MGQNLCDLSPQLQVVLTSSLYDDFFNYQTGGLFTSAPIGAGTVAADDTGGTDQLLLTTAGTGTDGTFVKTTKQNFLFTDGQPMYCQSKITYANQATTNAWVGFGFASTNVLTITSGLIPTASYSGALVFKQKGSTVWSVQTSNGSTKQNSDSNVVATDGSYTLSVEVNKYDGTYASVSFLVNGIQLTDVNNVGIKHKVAYASLVKMGIIAGTQEGSANAQTLKVDYIAGGKLRV